MKDYEIESIDERPERHKKSIIKNVIGVTKTNNHYVFFTRTGSSIKRRTDTWRLLTEAER